MRTTTSIVSAVIFAALLNGCNEAREPVAPPGERGTATQPLTPGPQPSIGAIAGFVMDESDQCIIGARVELIDGPRAGAAFVQGQCYVWGNVGDDGYSFTGLPAGLFVTVRATAKGYKTAEKSAKAANPYSYTTLIVLTKEQ